MSEALIGDVIDKVIVFVSGAILAIGVVIAVYREDWLSSYIAVVGLAITLPIVLGIKAVHMVFVLFKLVESLAWMLLRAGAKFIVFIAVTAVVSIIIAASYFVPHIGRVVQTANKAVRDNLDTTALLTELRHTRRMMIEIIADQDDRSPKLSSEDQYREELVRVVDDGTRALGAGEGMLSLTIGGTLLISQIYDYQLFQAVSYGVSVASLIQFGLFVIAVSVLYRVSLLDFLAFSGNEEFASLAEMDVALTYQQAISRVGFIQHLMFLVVFGLRLMSADRRIVRLALSLRYNVDTTTQEWIQALWQEL